MGEDKFVSHEEFREWREDQESITNLMNSNLLKFQKAVDDMTEVFISISVDIKWIKKIGSWTLGVISALIIAGIVANFY